MHGFALCCIKFASSKHNIFSDVHDEHNAKGYTHVYSSLGTHPSLFTALQRIDNEM